MLFSGIFQKSLDFLNTYLAPLGFIITSRNEPYVFAGIIMAGLVIISLTPAADALLRFSYGFREPLRDEVDKLHWIFVSVCRTANKNAKEYRLYIADEPFPNAYALGRNNLAITRMLLKRFPEKEIKGVMAHELGHLHYGDTVNNRVFITVCLAGQVALIFFKCLAGISGALSKLPIPFINIIFIFISWLFSIIIWAVQLLLMLPLSIGAMFGSRKDEYRADRYAFEIGHGEGLYSFLYHILDMQGNRSNGLLAILHRTHPQTGERIRKLEEMEK